MKPWVWVLLGVVGLCVIGGIATFMMGANAIKGVVNTMGSGEEYANKTVTPWLEKMDGAELEAMLHPDDRTALGQGAAAKAADEMKQLFGAKKVGTAVVWKSNGISTNTVNGKNVTTMTFAGEGDFEVQPGSIELVLKKDGEAWKVSTLFINKK